MSQKQTKSDTIKKANFLKALESTLGVVSPACKKADIARSTYYEWYAGDMDFRKAVDELKDVALDFAESQLFARMQAQSDASIIFYLKTQGKKRGYVERSEVELRQNKPDFSNFTDEELRQLLDHDEYTGEEGNS
jgi:hypothetical protein